MLAGYVPALADCWDRLYDDNVLRGKYELPDLRLAASHLLRENYDLPIEAVATLIVGADPAALVVAVEEALFGPAVIHGRIGWWGRCMPTESTRRVCRPTGSWR